MTGGASAFEEAEPVLQAEDFSFLAQAAPGCMVFLGIRNDTAGSTHALHTDRFTMDEWMLHHGAALHASFAMDYLKRGSKASSADKSEL